MSNNLLALVWNQFQVNAPHTFLQLWNNQDFTDVTLATVDDQQIRAHKVILSSGSLFFQNIFLKHPHQNPLLYLKDVRYKDLELIIEFIYTGQCNVEHVELEHFLSVGRDLRVIGLLEETYPNEIQNLREDNVTEGNEFQRSNTIDTSFEETSKATREIFTEKNLNIC